MLGSRGGDIVRAREIYAAAVAEALERIQANNNCNRHVRQIGLIRPRLSHNG
jgi:hypothetical protein